MPQNCAKTMRFGILFDIENLCHIFSRRSAELFEELAIIIEELCGLMENDYGLVGDKKYFWIFARVIPGEIREFFKLYGWNWQEEERFQFRSSKHKQIADYLIEKFVKKQLANNDADFPEHIVLMSGDGHFVDMVRTLKMSGRIVRVVGWKDICLDRQWGQMNPCLVKASNQFIIYEELLARRRAKFQQKTAELAVMP